MVPSVMGEMASSGVEGNSWRILERCVRAMAMYQAFWASVMLMPRERFSLSKYLFCSSVGCGEMSGSWYSGWRYQGKK